MFVDEGLWFYIGKIWVENDIPPYTGSVENKTPAIFELYAISHYFFEDSLIPMRLLGILATLGTMLTLNKILETHHSKFAGRLAMLIYGLTMSWGVLDGQYPSLTENFLCLFSSMTFMFFLDALRKNGKMRNLKLLYAALCVSMAISFKQIAIVTLMFLIISLALYKNNEISIKQKFISVVILISGCIFTTFLILIPLFISGVGLNDYFYGAWVILLNNGSHNNFLDGFYEFFNVWTNSRIVTFYPLIILLFFNKELFRDKYFLLMIIWLFFEFIGINASGYFFEHQIKQLVPALSLITGILIANTIQKRYDDFNKAPKMLVSVFLSLTIILLPYKSLAINGYFKGFPQTRRQKIGLWIKENTEKNDYVFVFSFADSGPIMVYADRLSSSKYFNIIFVNDNNTKQSLYESLRKNKPKCIVINKNQWGKHKEFLDTFMSDYKYKFTEERYDIFLLKE